MAQKRNRAVQKPGTLASRNRAKLNSQTAQKAPIQPAPRTGPRRQLPPSTQGGSRVGNSSQPWGPGVGDGSNVRKVTVKDVTGPARLPGAKTAPTSKQLPGTQNVQPQARPSQPGTSRPPTPTRAQAATAKAAQSAKGSTSTGVRTGQPGRNTPTSARPSGPGTPQAESWLKDAQKARARMGKPTLRGVAGTAGSVGLSGLAAVSDYQAARGRGETRGRSAAQAGAGMAGGLAGARAGAMLPGGPVVRAIGALAGGALGYTGALKGAQGLQQAAKNAENKGKPTDKDPKPGSYGPPTPKNNLASSVKGRPVGQQAVRNGKPVAWDGYKWVSSRSVGQGSVAKAPKAPKLPAASTTASRSSSSSGSGYSSSSGSSRPSIRAAASAPKKPQPGQSKDMNENYQMWAKANPALAAKVKSNQSGYNAFAKDAVAGVGPVKDGSSYKPQAEKTSEMNASAVRRAALSASAGSATDSGSSDAPKEKPKGTSTNFRTDIALLDKKKKK